MPVKMSATAGPQPPFKTITTTQQFRITPEFLDNLGKPAPVDGEPTYASSDPSVVNVVPDPGGLSALVVAQGVGTYTVSVSADADLGEGVKTLVGQGTGDVTQGEAVVIAIKAGEVEEQPPVGPPVEPPPAGPPA